MRARILLACGLPLALLTGPAAATAQPSTRPALKGQTAQSAASGGAEYGTDAPGIQDVVPGTTAVIGSDGLADAPADAPPAVQQLIWAANRIVGSPYRLGGGHVAGFADDAYDCSGTVSYALWGGGLLGRPRDSSALARFGAAGPGTWVTTFANSGHAYLTVAGIRLDTSAADDPGGAKGPRWRPLRGSDRGFTRRHPVGL